VTVEPQQRATGGEPIPRRPFGRASTTVSELGFGCGGFWGLPVFPEREAARLLHHALGAGVTLLDTGPNYSGGHAEERLARISGGHYDGVLLATKVGSRLLPNRSVVRDFTPEGMEASLTDSLRRLRTDHVDLVQLHGPTLEALADDRLLGALDGFVRRGLARFRGVSGDGAVAAQVARTGAFDTLMTTYNVLTQESGPTIREAARNGIAVLVKSPLAHHVFGRELFRLTRLSKVWYLLRVLKNDRRLLLRGRRFSLAGLMPGWTEAEVALKFVLAEPAVACAVIGTTRLEHLAQNLAVCRREPLTSAVLARIATAGSPRVQVQV
jgi:aryl-alcohol dehydrogenase-like predicted oxidoreductase